MRCRGGITHRSGEVGLAPARSHVVKQRSRWKIAPQSVLSSFFFLFKTSPCTLDEHPEQMLFGEGRPHNIQTLFLVILLCSPEVVSAEIWQPCNPDDFILETLGPRVHRKRRAMPRRGAHPAG